MPMDRLGYSSLVAYTSTIKEFYIGFLSIKLRMCMKQHNIMMTILHSQSFYYNIRILCRPGLTTCIYIYEDENNLRS